MRGGQPGEAEEREPRGQLEQPGLGRDPLRREVEPLRRVGRGDPRPEPAPELGLPGGAGRERGPRTVHVLPRRPAGEHPRAVERVAVVEPGEVLQSHQARGPAPVLGRRGAGARAVAQVLAEHREPGLAVGGIGDLQERPERPTPAPAVERRVDRRGGEHRLLDERAGRGEGDAREDPVRPPRPRPEPRRERLGEPPLHPPGGDGDEFGRERVRRRHGQQPAEGGHERVGAIGSMDVEHSGQVVPHPAGSRSPRRS